MNGRVNHPAGQRRWIGIRSAHSNVIEPHVVVAPSVAATMVPIVAAAVAAASAVIAEEVAVVSEVGAGVFEEEEVAGADGAMGRNPKRR